MNTEQALIKRINRALAREESEQRVRVCRDCSRDQLTLGRYYAVDANRNAVTATHVDLEQWATELRAR